MAEPTADQKFSKLASDYCAFLEDHCAYSAKQFTTHCASLLVAINETIPDLPQHDTANAVKVDVGPTNWIARNIIDKISDQNKSTVLSDELTAIYRYLKSGLLLYGTDPASAVAYWTSHFAADCQSDLQRAQAGLN